MRDRINAGGRPIALSVATDVAHKNLSVLLRGLALIDPERRPLLVFAGFGTDTGELPGLVAELGLGGDVRLLGAVAADDLEALYAQAGVLVTPTLYEGFGLPVLEAMARGVLVACSAIPVLSEVAGEDAQMFDPHDPASVASAIEKVLAGGEALERRRASARARAARHTWATSAMQTLRAFDEATAERER
jgi:glycosyltransferase involved in cell wall biosynthesis